MRTSLAVPVAQPLDMEVQRAGAVPRLFSKLYSAMNAGNDRERADTGRDRRSAPAHTPKPRVHVVKIIQVQSLTVEQIVNLQTRVVVKEEQEKLKFTQPVTDERRDGYWEMLRCIAMSHATSACPTCRVKSTSFRDRRCVKLSLATEIYCWSPETAPRMEEMNKSIERRVPNWRTSLRPCKRN